ncbi:MAG: GLPGLI family protein [Sediminibacterium sp.]
MKFFLTTLSVILLSLGSDAQQIYITKGKIEYEKLVNTHKVMEESWGGTDKSMLELFKKNVAPVGTSYFDLYFNGDKSLYKPGREVQITQRPPDWASAQGNDNIVFNDLTKQTTTSQKNVYENTYLVQDSLRTLNWKITTDTRTIAGLECRRATAVMMDSVFVVAFFTEQILCTSGPEGFNGLPGMILGLVIPRLHMTWYASKLELIDVRDTDLPTPKKGKPINNKELQLQLQKLMKDWGGRTPQRGIWQIMI